MISIQNLSTCYTNKLCAFDSHPGHTVRNRYFVQLRRRGKMSFEAIVDRTRWQSSGVRNRRERKPRTFPYELSSSDCPVSSGAIPVFFAEDSRASCDIGLYMPGENDETAPFGSSCPPNKILREAKAQFSPKTALPWYGSAEDMRTAASLV